MNLSVILENIPVAASFLLVVVGAFIAYEIYRMIASKTPKVEKKQKPVESPDTMEPLVFPKVTGARIKKTSGPKQQVSSKTILISAVSIILVITIGGGAYYAYASGFTLETITGFFANPLTTPDSIDPLEQTARDKNYNATVSLYQETAENPWIPLSPEQLSTLKAGDIIRIEVTIDQPADRIAVAVNQESIPLSPNMSPNGNPYARYIIPDSQSQYTVAVQIY